MFLDTHAPRLDEKGRMFLPAKYRDELSGGVVITKGQERCLYVFPTDEFGRMAEALRTAPVTAKGLRDYSRVFFASASDEVPDKQGRITVPAALRTYAGLERDCVVIGANTRLEIWDAQAWETYLAAQEDSFSEAAEEVLPGILLAVARSHQAATSRPAGLVSAPGPQAGATSPAPGRSSRGRGLQTRRTLSRAGPGRQGRAARRERRGQWASTTMRTCR